MHSLFLNKRIYLITGFFLCIFLILFCSSSVYKAKSKILLTTKKISIYTGDSYRFKLKKCSYKSSNKKIVSVSRKGKLKAHKPGNAKITIRKNKSAAKAVCKIKVGKHATSVRVDGAATVLLNMGENYTIKTTVLPSKVLYKNVDFLTKDSNIISVNSKGVVTPVSPGIATVNIVSKATDSKNRQVTAKVTVIVKADNNIDIKQDLNDDIGNFGNIVIVPTRKPTSTPSLYPTASPEIPDIKPSAPVETPTTCPPTEVPEIRPTAEPTKKPQTVEELINSATPDPNSPLVLSFVLSDSSNNYRTVYLFDKNYSGVMSVTIDGYSYTNNASVTEFLTKLQKETGSVTNSSGTVTVERRTKKESWKVILHEINKTYYFSGRINDTTYNSGYGILIADGNTLDNIVIK